MWLWLVWRSSPLCVFALLILTAVGLYCCEVLSWGSGSSFVGLPEFLPLPLDVVWPPSAGEEDLDFLSREITPLGVPVLFKGTPAAAAAAGRDECGDSMWCPAAEWEPAALLRKIAEDTTVTIQRSSSNSSSSLFSTPPLFMYYDEALPGLLPDSAMAAADSAIFQAETESVSAREILGTFADEARSCECEGIWDGYFDQLPRWFTSVMVDTGIQWLGCKLRSLVCVSLCRSKPKRYLTEEIDRFFTPEHAESLRQSAAWMNVRDGGGGDTPPAIWIGNGGLATQTHFDLPHNVFVQLVGRKRFHLFAPHDADAFYLFPTFHPRARKSSLNPARASVDLFPRFGEVVARSSQLVRWTLQPVTVTLSPGDVLYIPPFWLHHVETLEFSVSLNRFSESGEERAMRRLERIPLPFEESWSPSLMQAASDHLIARVIERVVGSADDIVPVIARLLHASLREGRESEFYFSPNVCSENSCFNNDGDDGEEDFTCYTESEHAALLNETAIQLYVETLYNSVFIAIKTGLKEGVGGARQLALNHYIQMVAYTATGGHALGVSPFLRRCLYHHRVDSSGNPDRRWRDVPGQAAPEEL